MKKLSILALIISAAVIGCKKNKTSTATQTRPVSIGIAKIITHPALDSIEQGIKDELAERGYTDIRYNVQNANGELSTASTIANMFRNEKVDIAVGIATPTALALANQIKDRPVIFSAVTDPVGAGLHKSLDAEPGNIAGVSDMAPVKAQIQLIADLKPVKRIGHIYTPSEANGVSMKDMAQAACDEMGIELVLATVTNTSEIKQAAEILAPKVDAIYVSNDNTVVAALSSLTETATRYGVPVISADPSSAPTSGVTIAYGIDNYQTGRATGIMISQILEGAKPSELPVKVMDQPHELAGYIDPELVKRFELTVPAYME